MKNTKENPSSTTRAEMLIFIAAKQGVHNLKFPFYVSEDTYGKDIIELDLSQRGMNCLKRAGIKSIGELVEKITGPESLKTIRGLGNKTADEILYDLYLYQYSILSPTEQNAFLKRTAELTKLTNLTNLI